MVVAVIVLLVVGFFALVPPLNSETSTHSVATQTTTSASSCPRIVPAKDEELTGPAFDGVTEFNLPSPDTSPNAITVSPDGSVWFGENGLPGLGHLFPNGTLTEYKLPFAVSSEESVCGQLAYIWGVALWNGAVWAADEDQAQLEGVNPATGAVANVTLSKGTVPYTLAVGPDGDLWFTQLDGGPVVGRVTPNTYAVQLLRYPGNESWFPVYVAFANSSLGYLLSINPILAAENPNAVTSILYSFNPEQASPTFREVGMNTTLYEPSSIAVGEGGIWLTEHSGSSMAFFNTTTSEWTLYPTSLVPYVPTTLTYFDAATASSVWFNEHYGNKIGTITDDGKLLTEYSVSNPPVENFSVIADSVNTLTMAIGDGRTWFTQWSANVIGFVSQSYVPTFNVSTQKSAIQLQAGTGSAQVQLQLSGQDSRNLSVQFSDNELSNSTAKNIAFASSVTSLRSLDGTQSITVTVSAASEIKPGDYTAAMTVTDGLVLQSVYITIAVSA